MQQRATARARIVGVLSAAAVAVALLAGCVAQGADTDGTGASSAATAGGDASASPTDAATGTATPKPSAAALALKPKGTALQNIDYFNQVVTAVLDDDANAGGRTIIDALVDAGFAKKNMQVTPDKTAVGLDADNKQFSVEMKDTCIIGQSGNTGFQSFAAPVLATGSCLVGTTRPIDW